MHALDYDTLSKGVGSVDMHSDRNASQVTSPDIDQCQLYMEELKWYADANANGDANASNVNATEELKWYANANGNGDANATNVNATANADNMDTNANATKAHANTDADSNSNATKTQANTNAHVTNARANAANGSVDGNASANAKDNAARDNANTKANENENANADAIADGEATKNNYYMIGYNINKKEIHGKVLKLLERLVVSQVLMLMLRDNTDVMTLFIKKQEHKYEYLRITVNFLMNFEFVNPLLTLSDNCCLRG